MRPQHAQLLIKREDDLLRHQHCTTDGRAATSLAKWCCRHNLITTRWLPTLSVDNKHTCEKESGKTRRNQHSSAPVRVRRGTSSCWSSIEHTEWEGMTIYYIIRPKKCRTPSRDLMQPSNIPILSIHVFPPGSSKERFVPAKETIKGFWPQKKGSKYTCNFNKWKLTMLIMFYHCHHLLLIKTENGKGKKKYGIWHPIN